MSKRNKADSKEKRGKRAIVNEATANVYSHLAGNKVNEKIMERFKRPAYGKIGSVVGKDNEQLD